MKLAIFALVAGLCLLAVQVQADTVVRQPFDSNDSVEGISFVDGGDSFDEALAAGLVEPEPQGFLFGFYWVLKGALKTYRGLKCTVQEVHTILEASQNFLTSVDNCHEEVSADVAKVVDAVKKLITISKQFDTINQSYCKSKSQTRTGWNCFWKMLKQSLTLTHQINQTLKLLQKVPTTGANANSCVSSAVYKLYFTYSLFQADVKACSKGK